MIWEIKTIVGEGESNQFLKLWEEQGYEVE